MFGLFAVSSVERAVHMQEYNPPPPEEVDRLLQDLIKYVAVDYSADILVKVALLYYQFETIHPFNSGNGRAGRLLPVVLLRRRKFEEAVNERNRAEKKLQHGTKFTRELSEIYNFLEKKPVFMIKNLVDTFHMSYHTAASRVDILIKMSVVKQHKEQHRNRMFIMQAYFDVFADDIARSGISSN